MQWAHGLFLRIYTFSFPQLLFLFIVYGSLFWYLRQHFHDSKLWQPSLGFLLLVWAVLVLYATLLGRKEPGSITALQPLFQSYREWKHGGNPEILRSNFMNALLFLPGGLLLGTLLPERMSLIWRMMIPVLVLTLFSLGIEAAQLYLRLGISEWDDVVHNSLGGLFGNLLACAPLLIKKDRS